jgi:thiosulfate/3-mercaptopyruvate sulfurtransferase
MSQEFSSLVSAQWLVERLGEPGIRVIDIRGAVRAFDAGNGRQVATYEALEADYLEGHIPGAVFVDWTRDIVDPDAHVSVQIAPPDRFGAAMGRFGVGAGHLVVAVDATGGHLATRLWWGSALLRSRPGGGARWGYGPWLANGFPTERGAVSRGTIGVFGGGPARFDQQCRRCDGLDGKPGTGSL